MNVVPHRSDVASDWYELPSDVWSTILSCCDYTTSTHLAVAFAFSSKYRKILRLLEPLNISDLLTLAKSSTKSDKNPIEVLITSVRLRAATLCSPYPFPADSLLRIPAVVQLSEHSLEKLTCYLEDFSVLLRFPCLKDLQLLASETKEQEDGDGFCWDLRPEQATALAELPALTKLCFVGFTAVDLSIVRMPQLKELTINFQTVGGILETQNRLVFGLPQHCLLDKLIVLGPEDQESDSEEEGEFSMTTNVNLAVLSQSKVIHISGASIVFDILDASLELEDHDHLSAAAACIVNAQAWTELQVELIKYLDELDNINPDLCVYLEDQGTEEIYIKNGLMEAINAAAAAMHAEGQNISCHVTDEFMPFDFDSTMDLDNTNEEEDGSICDGDQGTSKTAELDNDDSSSEPRGGVITTTLLIQRQARL